jgi:DNA polymerase-3 subunit delta
MLYSLPNITEQSAAAALGVNPFFVKEYIATARRYDYEGIEKVLLLLHQYNLRSIGVHDAGTSDAGLLKELAVKMIA